MTRHVAFLRGVSPINAKMPELKRFAADPWADFDMARNAKRVVTFLREPLPKTTALPPETDGVRLLAVRGGEVFTAYVPQPGKPVFMKLLEKTFGTAITTRTWDTVKKCASA